MYLPKQHVVETFPPDRADQLLRIAVLPRRAWRNRLVMDAHGAQPSRDGGAVNAVPVVDQIAGVPHPTERLP
jgi:hypothetical protein